MTFSVAGAVPSARRTMARACGAAWAMKPSGTSTRNGGAAGSSMLGYSAMAVMSSS